MYLDAGCSTGATSTKGLLTRKAVLRDDESRLAATLRTTLGGADATTVTPGREPSAAVPALDKGSHSKAKQVVAEIMRTVEARLPGRVRGLKVEVQSDQFILRGVSSSYYVKQVAGHLAMTAMDACMLGRLVNEIEVRSAR
jgi:hypothetical protein